MTMTKSDPERAERRRVQKEVADQLKESGALDEIFARIDAGESLTGHAGLLKAMLKASLERGLDAELSDHVGYDRGDPDAAQFPNSRNGTFPKTVACEIGDVELAIPRDRNGTFSPMLVPKGVRRLDGLDAMIVSLYAGGMTVRDIAHHLASTISTELSPETISNVVDAVADEVLAWQQRPLEALYPVIYLDAIVIKVRDGGHVRNKAAHIAVGVDMDGIKHVLGIWVQTTEGAKFWAAVCAELANRGVRDVLIVCCDGLTGFPEAIEATWPQATVQTSLVHNGPARKGSGCHPHRRERASADRPSRSRCRPVPPVGDGLRTASRSCAASAITSDGGGLSTRVSEPQRRRSCPCSLASIGVPPIIKSPSWTTPVRRCSTSDTPTPLKVSTR
jgi:putative transposase